ncbi:hypothetical protein IAR50_005473 [Cryptococcus sp. DSM 104548]
MPPSDTAASSDTASLKRMREGSLEPVQLESSSSLATKKNRVASSIASHGDSTEEIQEDANEDKDSDKSGDEKNVGEVRKKVEKLSHEEKVKASAASSPEQQVSAVPIKEVEKAAGDVDEPKGEGLKRKALDRNETSFSQVEDDVSSKRQKDTPPPTEDQPAPPKKQPTFASFASSTSPFASTTEIASPAPELQGAAPAAAEDVPAVAQKKPATFGDFANKSPFGSTKPTPSATPILETPSSTSEPAAEPPKKTQSTFSSFSASASPFGSKPKQPSAFSAPLSKTSAFGNYSTSTSAFGAGAKAEGDKSPEEGKRKNFGDILKDTKEDLGVEKEKLNMQEQDVTTGEEDEDTVFQVRAKLFVNEKGWKERGIGLLRVNVRRDDGGGARLVMRADGVLRLLLNSKLYKGLNPKVEGKTVLMTLPNVGENKMAVICLRLSNAKSAEDLADHIHEHIPLDNPSPSKSPQPEV